MQARTPLLASLVTTILADRASLDCPLRQIGLDYAQMVQPQWRPLAAFQELADALNGAAEAVNCHIKPSMRGNESASTRRVKTNIVEADDAVLAAAKNLRAVHYEALEKDAEGNVVPSGKHTLGQAEAGFRGVRTLGHSPES